jgi:transcriptional regulator with XRE-family HTH domain
MMGHMPSHRHDWGAVKDSIRARMNELQWNQADLVRESGYNENSLSYLLRGDPRGQPNEKSRWKLCRALGWTPDSIDRILEGGKPILLDVTPRAAAPLSLAEAGTEELLRQAQLIDQLAIRVAQLEEQIRRLGPPRRGREEV